MKITKIRTIAVAYPYESLESEILMDNDKYIYLNFDYRDIFKDNTIEEYWTYEKPLDTLIDDDWNGIESLSIEETKKIINQMKKFFTINMNGKWDETNAWHKFE